MGVFRRDSVPLFTAWAVSLSVLFALLQLGFYNINHMHEDYRDVIPRSRITHALQ